MRNVTAAMAAWLQNDARTTATCVRITRADGAVYGFTDHDVDIQFGGLTYQSSVGYTASAIENSGDLSTSNMEVDGLLLASGGAITQTDIEGGLWSNAAVVIFVVNYADLTMGSAVLNAGNLGNFSLFNGSWKVELRGLAQTMQQATGEQFSAGCRADFGDARCKLTLSDKTFSGSVSSVLAANVSWSDPTLTQTGPTSPYTDTSGHTVPTAAPYQVQIAPPSGSFVANTDVRDPAGNTLTQVSGSPASGQYSVSPSGLYTFNSNNAGNVFYIDYTFATGYFAYGSVKWVTGLNAGLTSDVRTFSPGVVTLGMPTPHAISPGDQYTIVAGCDKQFGTCKARWNNVVNFRGEPYVPGPDSILRPQG